MQEEGEPRLRFIIDITKTALDCGIYKRIS